VKLSTLNKRLATVATVSAIAVAGTGALVPASAQAAPTYWTFKNTKTGTCLTAGTSGVAFLGTCNGSSYQQWDWLGNSSNGDNQLLSRATGLCLATDHKNSLNAVWTSSCNWVDGQRWYYNAATKRMFSYLSGYLMSSPDSAGVYVADDSRTWLDYMAWDGSHT
jgi:hypothetical protein